MAISQDEEQEEVEAEEGSNRGSTSYWIRVKEAESSA